MSSHLSAETDKKQLNLSWEEISGFFLPNLNENSGLQKVMPVLAKKPNNSTKTHTGQITLTGYWVVKQVQKSNANKSSGQDQN